MSFCKIEMNLFFLILHAHLVDCQGIDLSPMREGMVANYHHAKLQGCMHLLM
jgi:hypothetical protein